MARSLSRSSACCRKNRQVAPTAITAVLARTRSRSGAPEPTSTSTRSSSRSRKRANRALPAVEGLDRGPVLLQEAEDLMAGQHDPDVTVEHLTPGRLAPRLLLGPRHERVELREIILGEAVDDIFLGLEVVVQGGLGHP